MSTFDENFGWQKQFYKQVKYLLTRLAPYMVIVENASEEEDLKHATDFNITLTTGAVGCRVRRANCGFRDLTLRSFNRGGKTEIHKVRKGEPRWYFYAWEDPDLLGYIGDYMLLDMDKFRESGLLDRDNGIGATINTGGNTGFEDWCFKELEEHDVIVEKTDFKNCYCYNARRMAERNYDGNL